MPTNELLVLTFFAKKLGRAYTLFAMEEAIVSSHEYWLNNGYDHEKQCDDSRLIQTKTYSWQDNLWRRISRCLFHLIS